MVAGAQLNDLLGRKPPIHSFLIHALRYLAQALHVGLRCSQSLLQESTDCSRSKNAFSETIVLGIKFVTGLSQ
jgi:hypothetical protein